MLVPWSPAGTRPPPHTSLVSAGFVLWDLSLRVSLKAWRGHLHARVTRLRSAPGHQGPVCVRLDQYSEPEEMDVQGTALFKNLPPLWCITLLCVCTAIAEEDKAGSCAGKENNGGSVTSRHVPGAFLLSCIPAAARIPLPIFVPPGIAGARADPRGYF